tara:strand:+ start:12331 stop:13230 length:900 start_codon:yes stop_codon:yes gene_type:complete
MALCFLFIDGIGIGERSSSNPLSNSDLKSFSYFTGSNGFDSLCEERMEEKTLFKKIDANLDVEGLPQSGTGQTTLFTGENASKVIGKHFGPYPHSGIKPLLKEKSLFHKAIELGKNPHFINAYPDIFFKKSTKRDRWSCTTLMTKSAGLRLNRLKDVIEGNAITAEITQSVWRSRLNLDVPEIKPEEASGRVLQSLEKHDLVLYEYYLTDKAGHEQSREMADQVLSVLDQFIWGIMQGLSREDTLVITSDHGNLEDLTVKTHTRNPVPLFVMGQAHDFQSVRSIQDVTPAILDVMRRSG